MNNMPIPKLRFKDNQGRDYPDKIVKRIESLILEYKEKVDANSNLPILTSSKQFGIEFQEDHFAGKQRHDIEGYNVLPRNYCTYRNRSDGLDFKFNINTICEKGIISKFYPVFKGNNCNLYFLKTLLNNDPATLRKIAYTAKGTSQKVLSLTDLKKITVTIPTLPEQEKIADFLSNYDRMIDVQSQRVETMKTRKKGLLQKIFSQEIRFRDDEGKEFPEWEEKKLGEVTLIERGAAPRPIEKYITSNDEGINWIKIGDAPIDGNVISNVKEKITDEGASKSRAVKKGDLILSNSMSYGRPYLLNVDGCIHDGWLLIRNSQNKFDSAFLLHFLSSPFVKMQYERLSNQGVVSNLNKELVKSVNVYIPALPEQQKIADFFNAVDKQIEVEEKRLETMKNIKKGLLQQMFI